MPCRVDLSPQEIEQSRKHVDIIKKQEKAKQDKITQDLCEARRILLDITSGRLSIEDFKSSEHYTYHTTSQLSHRKHDQQRAIKEQSARLTNSKSEKVRQDALVYISQITDIVSDEDLLNTHLF